MTQRMLKRSQNHSCLTKTMFETIYPRMRLKRYPLSSLHLWIRNLSPLDIQIRAKRATLTKLTARTLKRKLTHCFHRLLTHTEGANLSSQLNQNPQTYENILSSQLVRISAQWWLRCQKTSAQSLLTISLMIKKNTKQSVSISLRI